MSPLVKFRALSFLHCFDTVGWKDNLAHKNVCQLSYEVLSFCTSGGRKLRRNRLTQLNLERGHKLEVKFVRPKIRGLKIGMTISPSYLS